jgi:pimeloyl-ACP methyl ester carboxylesterase
VKNERFVDTPDGRVFAWSEGETKAGGADALLLHGFPTSSHDFGGVLPALARDRRVVGFDFIGFGRSAKPAGFGYSLMEQADVAIAVARAFGVERANVLSHDMGTSVLTELLARRERGLLPFAIDRYVLMNGSVHIELASLTVGQKLLKSPLGPLFARANNARTFKAQLRRVFAKPPSDEELDVMWKLASQDDGVLRFPQIIRYTEERARFRARWIGALERCDLPALVAWGARDPVAVLAIARALASEIRGSRLVIWEDLGHYPQVEDPERVAAEVSAFFRAPSR